MIQLSEKVTVIYPGEQLPQMTGDAIKIYLAGTIDFGSEENNWQNKFEQGLVQLCDPIKGLLLLKNTNFIIFDPRTPLQNPVAPDLDNPEFVQTMDWRLTPMDQADFVFCNIMNKSVSPVPILEFGSLLGSGKLVVRCGEKHQIYSHIRIYCEKYSVPLLTGKTTVKDVILCAGSYIRKFQEIQQYSIPE